MNVLSGEFRNEMEVGHKSLFLSLSTVRWPSARDSGDECRRPKLSPFDPWITFEH